MKNYAVWGLVMLLGMGGVGLVMGQGPDPAEVQRLKEMYIREGEAEAKKAAPKPRPKPVVRPKPAPAVDHDREAWQSAEKYGTAACFEAYLEDYPKGRYVKMARAWLNTEPVPSSAPLPAVELQSRPTTPVPARLAIPTLPASTPGGGSVVGGYALQENAYTLRDYYRTQNVRAEAERIMVNDRPMYQVRVWR